MEPAEWWMHACEIALVSAEQELRWEVEDIWRPDDERLRNRREQRSAIYRAGSLGHAPGKGCEAGNESRWAHQMGSQQRPSQWFR